VQYEELLRALAETKNPNLQDIGDIPRPENKDLVNALMGVASATAGMPMDTAYLLQSGLDRLGVPNPYPLGEYGSIPGTTDWIGGKMGADVNSLPFLLSSMVSPSGKATRFGKVLSMMPDSLKIDRKVERGLMGSGFPEYEYTVVSNNRAQASISVNQDGSFRLTQPDQKALEWAKYGADGARIKQGQGAFVEPSKRQLSEWDELAKSVAEKINKNMQNKPDRPVFLRFNKLPKSGRSLNHATGVHENGVSVFGAEYDHLRDGYVYSQQGSEPGAIFAYVFKGERPYIVTGDVSGIGSDGEPVLRNVKKLFDLDYVPGEGIFRKATQ